jgi:pimeloyl-ACP methyl ester carboxylesterase
MHTYKIGIVAVLSLSFLSSSCQKAVSFYDKSVYKTYEKKGFQEKVLHHGDHTLHYFDNESLNKPVILFIHGFGGDGKVTWERQVKKFSNDYRIVVPDLLWFGKSHSNSPATLESQVGAMYSLVEQLQLNDVHMVGISYGGFVALAYASNFEHTLSSLTIVASPGDVMEDIEVEEFCRRNNVNDVKEIFVPKNAQDVKRLFKISMVNPPPFPLVVYEAIFEKYFSRYPAEQAELLDDLPTNKDKVADTLSLPTLVLWGAKDEIFHVRNAYKLQEKLNAQLVINDTTGHTYPGEEAAHFNGALLAFIEAVKTTVDSN